MELHGERLSFIEAKYFPVAFRSHGMAHRAVVGIGGNVGDVAARFGRVVAYWQRNGRVRVLKTSPLLKNPPFGFLDQPDFLNAVMLVETNLDPLAFMRYLLWVEKRFGRKRTFKNAPRTLDLDIIFYDNVRLKTLRLEVPHPKFHERDSVMIPLRFLKDGKV
jgi:2-amino-4-hydroxy-6-hydroxymethyldihydropteridine diphosphokinase